MTDNTEPTIEELVERVYLFGMNGGLGYGKFKNELSPKEATQAIKDLMLDIVGEDESEFDKGMLIIHDENMNPKEIFSPHKARNNLRQQLRQKIEEL